VSAPPGHRGARPLLSESLRRDLVQAMGPYRTPQGSGRPATVRSKRPPHAPSFLARLLAAPESAAAGMVTLFARWASRSASVHLVGEAC
jgi:hypothetical protein